jgi:hypothetical protein
VAVVTDLATEELVDFPEELLAQATPEELEVFYGLQRRLVVEMNWEAWLRYLLPGYFGSEFGEHHKAMWEWIWSLKRGVRPDAQIDIWPRGHGKSTGGEAACCALGARGVRRYGLYVCETQPQADGHVANIAGMLESPRFAEMYPAMADRALNKFGSPRGWRRQRLTTAAGFAIDAMGLDAAYRGVKFDEQRPDFIIIDDIDNKRDNEPKVLRKIEVLSSSLIGAGAPDVAVLGIQNLVHGNSVFARLAAKTAGFLNTAKIIGPIPAVKGLEYAGPDEEGTYEITAGEPTWSGMDLKTCNFMLNDMGPTAFGTECQHEEAELLGGLWDEINFGEIWVAEQEVPLLQNRTCWVDPAVTATDKSDSMGIVIGGLGVEPDPIQKVQLYYCLWAWERVTTPLKAIQVGIIKAMEYGCSTIGIETDNGGMAWESVYRDALQQLKDNEVNNIPVDVDHPRLPKVAAHYPGQPPVLGIPRYEYAKAGVAGGSKIERANRMLVDYEFRRFRHVRGACQPLERGLKRFPRYKPFDIVDADYWMWSFLRSHGGDVSQKQGGFTMRPTTGSLGEIGPANLDSGGSGLG